MRTVQAVAWKEIQIYFSSPTAYIVAMIFLALASFFFVRGLSDPVPQASMSGFFQGATIIFALLTPTLTILDPLFLTLFADSKGPHISQHGPIQMPL